MQARVRLISDPLMVDHLMFPKVSNSVQTWLHNQMYAPIDNLVGIAATMYQHTKSAYEDINNAIRLSNIKAAIRSIEGQDLVDPNTIQNICNSNMLHTANPTTQRYIMAMPELRELYHKQRVDGYSATYHDSEPGCVGKDHYDYRRVTDGVIIETEDSSTLTHYFQEDLYDEGPIDAIDKAITASMWTLVFETIRLGGDPTMIR